MSGCLPMLIQMPVFIGFFTMIRSAIELRGAHFLWVADLSKPDTLFMIPGLNFPFNLLPLLMGGAMLWQSHLHAAVAGHGPDAGKNDALHAADVSGVPLQLFVGPGALLTVSTLLTVLQTKLTQNEPDSGARRRQLRH